MRTLAERHNEYLNATIRTPACTSFSEIIEEQVGVQYRREEIVE